MEVAWAAEYHPRAMSRGPRGTANTGIPVRIRGTLNQTEKEKKGREEGREGTWDSGLVPGPLHAASLCFLLFFSPETGEPGGDEARPRSMAADAPVSGQLGMVDAEGVSREKVL